MTTFTNIDELRRCPFLDTNENEESIRNPNRPVHFVDFIIPELIANWEFFL